MISEAELSRLSALIAECAKPHCGNGPRNSLTSALHQIAPALIPELQRLTAERAELVAALREIQSYAGLLIPSKGSNDAAKRDHILETARALLSKLGESA